MSFNEKLQYLRKEKKYSQEELADMLDVTRQSVSKWESGQTYPEMDKLLAMCKIFNCTLDELTNDEVKEINTEKKAGFNSVIDNVLELITKGYKVITNMKFLELLRCIFIMIIVGCGLLLFLIPLQAFEDALLSLFMSFGSEAAAYVLSGIFNILLNTTYFIVYILLFVFIFKIGFIDKYEFVSKKESDKKEKENSDEEDLTLISEKKKEIKYEPIIIDSKNNNNAFFKVLGGIAIVFLKIILVCLALPFIGMVFGFSGLLVVDIYLLFQGVEYYSVLVIIIFSLIFNIIITNFFGNIIFNKKNNYKSLLLFSIICMFGLGIGAGVGVLEFHNTKFINEIPENQELIKQTSEYEFNDDLTFEVYAEANYVVDETLKNKIVVELEYYKEYNNITINESSDRNFYNIHYSRLDETNWFNYVNLIIDNLKEKKVLNTELLFEYKITIYGKASNLDKLKDNVDTYYKNLDLIQEHYNYYENEIDGLQEQIDKLNDKIYELEEDKEELKQKNDELKTEIQEYKDRVKSIVE